MEHNLDFGIEAQANHALALLRAIDCDTTVTSGERFAPGIFLSSDPESDTKMKLVSRRGELAEFRFSGSRPGRWLSLNIELGPYDLTARSVIGFMCKIRSDSTTTLRACLRSGNDNGFHDSFYGKRVVSFNDISTHADLFKLEEREDIPQTAPWRELLIFLPPDIRHVSLIDLALFGV